MNQFDFYRKLYDTTHIMFMCGTTNLLIFEDFPKKDFYIIIDISVEEEGDIKGMECQLKAIELNYVGE